MLYEKLNRLTSLCYPEYKKHETITVDGEELKLGTIGAKERMKPPLTKLRIGELFGRKDNELTGFIKSLTHTFPDEGPWETKQGKRVPKHVTAAITFQVMNNTPASLDFARSENEMGTPNTNSFYGINQTIGRD